MKKVNWHRDYSVTEKNAAKPTAFER